MHLRSEITIALHVSRSMPVTSASSAEMSGTGRSVEMLPILTSRSQVAALLDLGIGRATFTHQLSAVIGEIDDDAVSALNGYKALAL